MNKFDSDKIQEAYSEAITHLEACALQEDDLEQQRAYDEVARRLSMAADRLLKRGVVK